MGVRQGLTWGGYPVTAAAGGGKLHSVGTWPGNSSVQTSCAWAAVAKWCGSTLACCGCLDDPLPCPGPIPGLDATEVAPGGFQAAWPWCLALCRGRIWPLLSISPRTGAGGGICKHKHFPSPLSRVAGRPDAAKVVNVGVCHACRQVGQLGGPGPGAGAGWSTFNGGFDTSQAGLGLGAGSRRLSPRREVEGTDAERVLGLLRLTRAELSGSLKTSP